MKGKKWRVSQKLKSVNGYVLRIMEELELSVKSLKEGTRTPIWLEHGTKLETRHKKNTKWLNKVPNSVWTKTQGRMSLVPNLCLSTQIFCAQKLQLHGSFCSYHSHTSKIACMHLSITLILWTWVILLKHKDKYNKATNEVVECWKPKRFALWRNVSRVN